MAILGQIPELAANDKVPGEYFKSVDETGSGVGTRYLWIVGLKATSGGDLTANSERREIFSDTEALAAYGANSEGYRMCLRALQYGVPIKVSAYTITSGGAAATATITIDGTWTTAGRLYYRVAGRPVGPIGVAATDDAEDVANAIAAFINADPAFAVTAGVAAGLGTDFVVTLTWGSQGVRGNGGILWQDSSEKPSGLTTVLAGGSATTSGGVYFTGGAGTEAITTLMTATYADEYYTQAIAFRDATNLAALETQIDNKLGPLEGRLECAVGALVGTLSASGSIAQTTLNDASFMMPWMEEAETPGEEIAAGIAAYRHLLESASNGNDPNQRYDDVPFAWIQPQEAPSKNPSRATVVSALNYGLSPLVTRNGVVYLVRAVTTRTLTDSGDADDGTIDVGTDRVAKRYREALTALLREHRQQHRYLDENPAEGEEPNVPTNTTYPARVEALIRDFNAERRTLGWITQIDLDTNQPRCAINADASTPRLVVYAPFTPAPLFHQTEGIVAKKKFTVAVTA